MQGSGAAPSDLLGVHRHRRDCAIDDVHRLVHLVAPAVLLARRGADPAEHAREGNRPLEDPGGLAEVALGVLLQEARDVDVARALVLARRQAVGVVVAEDQLEVRPPQPAHLVDLRKIEGLTGVREAQGTLFIGALTTHAAVASSELVRAKLPMAAEAASLIGDAQVRNLGTIGGSLQTLVGGNISVFSMLVGTPWEPPLAGSILFLEEVGEEPYRIDRWLTHFLLTGRLARCAGIVLGKFKDCGPGEKGSFQGTWTWQEVASDRLGRLGVPVLAGLRFGHVTDKTTLPVGALAELDVAKGTLTLLEPAVS